MLPTLLLKRTIVCTKKFPKTVKSSYLSADFDRPIEIKIKGNKIKMRK